MLKDYKKIGFVVPTNRGSVIKHLRLLGTSGPTVESICKPFGPQGHLFVSKKRQASAVSVV